MNATTPMNPDGTNPGRTMAELIDAVVVAEEALAALGETIDDEWSYVNDLRQAWLDRLGDAAAGPAAGSAVPAATCEAIDLAIDEAGRISDPHRAIDWLSTLPQLVLLALEG